MLQKPGLAIRTRKQLSTPAPLFKMCPRAQAGRSVLVLAVACMSAVVYGQVQGVSQHVQLVCRFLSLTQHARLLLVT